MATDPKTLVEEAASSSAAEPGSSSMSNGSEISKIKEEELQLALNHLVQGKRHMLVKDVSLAISSLGEACQILVEINGPLCADNAEAHFYYGKALLEQSRLDLAVFDAGQGQQGEKESDSEDEKEEGSDAEEDEEEQSDEAEGAVKKDEDNEAEAVDPIESELATENGSFVEKVDEKKEEDLNAPSPNGNCEQVAEAGDDEKPSTSSSSTLPTNGEKEIEEELSNLELAWEVLEVAKLGYTNQLQLVNLKLGEAQTEEEKAIVLKTKTNLQKRLAETHSLLGEVATESENYGQAVEEFKTGIQILLGFENPDNREIAQYYFQMGLAFSFGKNFQEAIGSFQKSKEIIEQRINNLSLKIKNKQTAFDLGVKLEDPNYTEDTELQELKALIPELDEKVNDTIDAERENKKTLEEEIKEQEIIMQCSPVKNPNPPAANDISHLVKKKKKAEDILPEAPPAKRACNEPTADVESKKNQITSTNGNGSAMET